VITAVDKLTLNLTTKIIFTREMLGYLYECDLSVVFIRLFSVISFDRPTLAS